MVRRVLLVVTSGFHLGKESWCSSFLGLLSCCGSHFWGTWGVKGKAKRFAAFLLVTFRGLFQAQVIFLVFIYIMLYIKAF